MSKKTLLFWSLVGIGIAVRILGLFYNGMHDYETFIGWGNAVKDKGLGSAFYGIYFPITYIFFGLGSVLAKFTPDMLWLPIKFFNLIFDFLTFVFLLKIFPKHKNQVLLSYWLNPWFIVLLSWQGIWDALMGLLVLISVWIFDHSRFRHKEIISGFFLGLALMVKPQVQVIVVGVALLFLYKDILHGKITKPLLFFISFSIPFFCFSTYFKLSGQSILFLSMRLLEVKKIFPVLVGSEVNIWHPISRFVQTILHQPGPIYLPYLDKPLFDLITYVSLFIMFIPITIIASQRNHL